MIPSPYQFVNAPSLRRSWGGQLRALGGLLGGLRFCGGAARPGLCVAGLRKLARQPNLWLALIFAALVAWIHAARPATPLSPAIGAMVPILTVGVVFLFAVRGTSRFLGLLFRARVG